MKTRPMTDAGRAEDEGGGMSEPSADWLNRNLTREEASAFLALFGGAWSNLRCFRKPTGEEWPVSFGKAECEWVPFRETWQHRFPALGLTTFEESEPKPALGMVEGSTWTEIHIGVTDFGRGVRDAFWNTVNATWATSK